MNARPGLSTNWFVAHKSPVESKKYFKDDGDKVQELCNYILDSRNVKVSENIRRKMQ